MKDIKYIPIEEKSLNDKLVNLYGPKIPGLYAAVKPLFDDPNAIKPALPLVLELNDDKSYENADLRVMIFGRETNNWNDKDFRKTFPFGSYNFSINTSEDVVAEIMGKHEEGEEDYFGLGDLYHGYFFRDEKTGKRGNTTPFTRRADELIDLLRIKLPNLKIEYLWNNVTKIGLGGKDFGQCCGKPTSEIREIERQYFNVVADEVRILKPDVIIFMTGFYADQEIKEKFELSEAAFSTIKEGLFLDRIEIPGVKYAARTIHPSARGQKKEYFNNHFEALVEDIMSVIL
uniref:Uracil-DNA glycosylase-like domain-containing protein n=1 Tax=uncultured Muribaculaceae bacterium TaxID=2301481 RepID=A0A6G8F3R3_9BACT|nr:hypothetical protein Muribac1_0210 [uncultured Muribaculaceae bacterium]